MEWPKNQFNLKSGYDRFKLSDLETSTSEKFYLWIHFDWPGGNVSGWWSEYHKEINRHDLNPQKAYPHTIYCTLWEEKVSEYLFDNYITAIQYWFFYPINDWARDHEGDWEHINIIVTSQFEEFAHIEKVQFYFHEKWMEQNNFDLSLGTHPVVFVGGSFDLGFWSSYGGHVSGSSYPGPGTWKNIAGPLNEKVLSNGRRLNWREITNENDKELDGWGIEILKDPEELGYSFFENNEEMSWLKANIFWGEPFMFPRWLYWDIDRIEGPYNNSGWRKLGSSATFSHYDN